MTSGTAAARPPRATERQKAADRGAVRRALLEWYDRSRRRLAFRGSSDPYAVLVSEVMLQQTQVARVEPAWRAFIARFPTLADLAAAPTGEVLRAWAGLGYNRRAVNLSRAARVIVAEHDGAVPDTAGSLERLPGIGPYTARAVAAIAFRRPVAPVDTNARRVVGRLVAGSGHRSDPAPPLPPGELQRAADELVDRARPADWAHAVMDLGSALCRPRPACADCPLRPHCRYAARASLLESRTGRSGVLPPPRDRLTAARRTFPETRRWLRGRLVERLRQAAPGAWLALPEHLGSHAREAVREAAEELRSEGLLELHEDCARLPG